MAQWVLDTPRYGNEHANTRRHSEYLRLDNNENTGPLPESVRSALKAAVDETVGDQARCALYPDDTMATGAVAAYVREGHQGIGGWPGCTEEHVLLANGCDQAIDLVLRAYCDPGTSVLLLRPTFPMYAHYLGATGATLESINYAGQQTDFEFPTDEIIRRAAQLRGKRTVVILANPDNPSGTNVPVDFIDLLREANEEALLIIDEAYFEFAPERSLLPHLSDDNENLIFLRSMSKCFGMAGLRLGFVVASRRIVSDSRPASGTPNPVAFLRKTRGPYDVNELALVAACAHLRDLAPTEAYVDDVMARGRPTTTQWLEQGGVAFAPGGANFCLVQCDSAGGDLSPEHLKKRGVLVRAQRFVPEACRPGEWFRMSYPRSTELGTLATALAGCGLPI